VIFVTVGTQLPFDRLIAAVDAWAGAGASRRVTAQIGPSSLRPTHIDARAFISPAECRRLMQEASVVVAHAGMGTILGALELGTPVLVMPRRAALGEHRNDHQLATARWFASEGSVSVAFDEHELASKLDDVERLASRERISQYASDRLIGALRSFIEGDRPAVTVARRDAVGF
jgi:UDP-N-acetylglucosamine transferase subunit ALG13